MHAQHRPGSCPLHTRLACTHICSAARAAASRCRRGTATRPKQTAGAQRTRAPVAHEMALFGAASRHSWWSARAMCTPVAITACACACSSFHGWGVSTQLARNRHICHMRLPDLGAVVSLRPCQLGRAPARYKTDSPEDTLCKAIWQIRGRAWPAHTGQHAPQTHCVAQTSTTAAPQYRSSCGTSNSGHGRSQLQQDPARPRPAL